METVPHHIVIKYHLSPLYPNICVKLVHSIFVLRWLRKDGPMAFCQAAPGFPSLLINALESLGITECPRYYSREYEHHGTLHCRVILVIARSDRYPDIQPWR